jgi:polysaccharide export outer membrane protein
MHSKLLCALALFLGSLSAQTEAPAPAAGETAERPTDPSYRINFGDQIVVSIFGEGDLGARQMVDRQGLVRLPLIGEVTVAGLTVREAENHIENIYRKEEILKAPQATIAMGVYAPREATVLGAIRSPGPYQFPPDAQKMDIRDVITRHGGFTPVAKSDAVAITRRLEDGRETILTVDVARLMFGRSRNRENDTIFYVVPGDRIFVPERLF